jgi:hypothetical protein
LVPVVSVQQTIGSQTITVNEPAFLSDLNGAPCTCIPFGGEPICILTLSAPNAALSQESGVYTWPSDLTAVMQSADVATLSSFLTAANIPSDQLIAGMTFAAALQVIAKICMVAQALLGATGAPIFTNGTTLSSTIGDSDLAPLAPTESVSQGIGEVGVSAPGGGNGGTQVPTQIGVFDFSSITASTTIGSMLDSISQQFVGDVNLGEFAS